MSSKLKGIAYIVTAAFGFSLMSVFVHLSGDLPPFQKAFFRNFAALIIVTVLIIKNKGFFIPKKENVPYLFCRALFGTIGLVCNFYAIDRLVLADANMLNKLSPFFAIILSVFLLKEKPSIIQIASVIIAFMGSLFIIKPTSSVFTAFPALIGALGGLGAGAAYTFVRILGKKGENSLVIIFFFSAFSCIFCLPFIAAHHEPMSLKSFVYLICAGVCASIGQFGITKAYIYAPAKEISVYDYTQVIFAAILGYIVFGQTPDILSFLGYFLICGAGIWAFLHSRKQSAN